MDTYPRVHAVVASVTDGDTLRLVDGTRIRLVGINAPEYEPWKHRIDFYGPESREFLRSLVDGRAVELEYDLERTDKYGRTLAYVYLEDGTFVNERLVADGYARSLYIRPNGRYYSRMKELEKIAKARHQGLWSR